MRLRSLLLVVASGLVRLAGVLSLGSAELLLLVCDVGASGVVVCAGVLVGPGLYCVAGGQGTVRTGIMVVVLTSLLHAMSVVLSLRSAELLLPVVLGVVLLVVDACVEATTGSGLRCAAGGQGIHCTGFMVLVLSPLLRAKAMLLSLRSVELLLVISTVAAALDSLCLGSASSRTAAIPLLFEFLLYFIVVVFFSPLTSSPALSPPSSISFPVVNAGPRLLSLPAIFSTAPSGGKSAVGRIGFDTLDIVGVHGHCRCRGAIHSHGLITFDD